VPAHHAFRKVLYGPRSDTSPRWRSDEPNLSTPCPMGVLGSSDAIPLPGVSHRALNGGATHRQSARGHRTRQCSALFDDAPLCGRNERAFSGSENQRVRTREPLRAPGLRTAAG